MAEFVPNPNGARPPLVGDSPIDKGRARRAFARAADSYDEVGRPATGDRRPHARAPRLREDRAPRGSRCRLRHGSGAGRAGAALPEGADPGAGFRPAHAGACLPPRPLAAQTGLYLRRCRVPAAAGCQCRPGVFQCRPAMEHRSWRVYSPSACAPCAPGGC